MDGRLKKIIFYYAASALIAAISVSAAIISASYLESLSKTSDQFRTIKINSVKMKKSASDIDLLTAKLISLTSAFSSEEGMEGAILLTVDAIKSRFKGVEVSISNFDKKDNEVSLSISLSGKMENYMDFISNIEYLQSFAYPVFFIDAVSISKASETDKETVVFHIKATIKSHANTTGGAL